MKKFNTITYKYVMENKKHMQYLGFCEQKGFLYSEYLGDGKYRVLALKDGDVNSLITFEGLKPEELNQEEEEVLA